MKTADPAGPAASDITLIFSQVLNQCGPNPEYGPKKPRQG